MANLEAALRRGVYFWSVLSVLSAGTARIGLRPSGIHATLMLGIITSSGFFIYASSRGATHVTAANARERRMMTAGSAGYGLALYGVSRLLLPHRSPAAVVGFIFGVSQVFPLALRAFVSLGFNSQHMYDFSQKFYGIQSTIQNSAVAPARIDNRLIRIPLLGLNVGIQLLFMTTVHVLHTFADISNGVLPDLVTRARKWRRNLRRHLRTWTPPFLRRNGPRYEHRPLVNCSRGTPEIRLLKLRRRWPLGRIRCELIVVDLHSDDLPDYEAISYHWGSAAFTEDIYLDGLPFRVAPIVQDLLYHLGSYQRDRLLWIDAICINQGDNAEKDVQIGLMRDVYRRAASVIVWLDGVEDPWMARRMLAGIWHEYVYGTTESCIKMVRTYSEPSAEAGWMQLINLFAHPWFCRVWVIQEIVLAKTAVVLASEQPLQFDHIAAFARMLTSQSYNVVLQRSAGPGIRDDAFWGVCHAATMAALTETRDDPRVGLALLLGILANFRATEDRDRVYGLLGLLRADEADQPHLQPDSSKTVEALYMDVARHLIPTSPYETLSFAGIGYRRKLDSLPSWAPDWTSLGNRDTHRQHLSNIQATAGFACGFGVGLCVAFSENTEQGAVVMQIQGHVLDEIHHMGPEMGYTAHNLGQGGSDEEMASVVRSHVGNRRLVLRYARQPYPTGQPLDEVFWRSLIADTQFERPAPATLGVGCRAWERIMHRVAGFRLRPDDAEEDKGETYDALPREEDMAVPNMAADPQFSLALEWNSARVMAATGRAMAVTKDGYVAVVPPKTEVGDLVCVFYGLNTPFLVRPQVNTHSDGGTRLVRLVGEAYVHGMMDGQAMMMTVAQPNVFDVI